MKNSNNTSNKEVPVILVGMGTCGIGNGAGEIYALLEKQIREADSEIQLKPVGCFGFCAREPLVAFQQPNQAILLYSDVKVNDAKRILKKFLKGKTDTDNLLCKISKWDYLTKEVTFGENQTGVPEWNQIPFYKGQQKIVLRNAGLINPESIDDYIAVGGYNALRKVLTEMTQQQVIQEVLDAGMRGRGGAGYPTGKKWAIMQRKESDKKYIICNADEGDPGAYMNRNEIESDPHSLLEGMMIGAFAMGADEGIAYVRAEYPLAVERLRKAIEQAKSKGLMGNNIMGTGFHFDMEIVEGAGAFVCGEETALIASIEGKSGRPMPRPPYPADNGLYGKPTNINNVETWCNIPVIIEKGAAWFRQTGTEKSPGTKVFSLVGKVKNTGLVELPLGSTLDHFVFQIGEGTGTQKRVKAVQTGGPSGGCIPVEHFNTPVDYESLASLGAIMGSGGMVVMDQDNCMVDVARYFLEFNASESCGKCTPCREGLNQALQILKRITEGKGRTEDLQLLEDLGSVIKDTALCGLGQTAPNPILTTLKYFRKEYEEHILENRCHAGICENLFQALCENSCPMHMNIPGYIALIQEDRIEDAFELSLRDNPLPGTIGRICHFHCQMRCRREMLDEPVSQGEIHRYLADTMYKSGREKNIYQKLIFEKLSPTNKKIAIVGAGPAGITAAFYLIRLGHDVTIYDSMPEAGGIVRFGIPQYRLPKAVVQKEIALLSKLGVKFKFNTTLGKDFSLNDLEEANEAVYLALGAWKESGLDIKNKNAEGVISGTELLKELALGKKANTGNKVIIIGAGNVAIDAARSLWRLGKEVTIVYRRDKCDMPANMLEIKEAEAEHIQFRYLLAPAEILTNQNGKVNGLKAEKMVCGSIDRSGRRKPVSTGQFEEIACDTIVMAVGEQVNTDYLTKNKLKTTENGTLWINKFTSQTSRRKIFAGGDIVTGPATAAEAMGMAKKAAESIDFILTGEQRFHLLFKDFKYNQNIPADPEKIKKIFPPKLIVEERQLNFLEVQSGFNGEQARDEVNRCLRCDIKCF